MHKESGQVVAIKQVPVDTDLQEIIKEISMMQQCDRYVTFVLRIYFSSLCHSGNTLRQAKVAAGLAGEAACSIEPFVV